MRDVFIVGLLVFGTLTTSGQQPVFDAASIRIVSYANHLVLGNHGGPGTDDPGRVHLCCSYMFSLIMRAFDVDLDQIAGPAWIMENSGPNLYQIDATMPATTTKVQFDLMMQNLLQERFHLRVHREKRNFPGYELVVAENGPKLKESKAAANAVTSDTSQTPKRGDDGLLILPPGPQMITTLGRGEIVLQAQQKSISELVKGMGRLIFDSLGGNINDFASPKPRVVDETGLNGKYDFVLRFSCELCQFAAVNGGMPALPNGADTDSFTGAMNILIAIQKQLGLKLVKVKDIPSDIIVVDHVDKTPTEN